MAEDLPPFVRKLELPGTKVEEFPLELSGEAKAKLAKDLAAIRECERAALVNAHNVWIF